MNLIKYIAPLTITLLCSSAYAEAQAPVETEELPISGWARLDNDALGFTTTVGAIHQFNDSFGIVSDVLVQPQNTICADSECSTFVFGELDLGAAIFTEHFELYPMVGIGWDWQAPQAFGVYPQLYVYGSFDKLNTLVWSVYSFDPFSDSDISVWHNRLNATYQILEPLSVGPQVEGNWDFNTGKFTHLPVGARVDTDYGNSTTLALFPAYDVVNDVFAGRISLIYGW